MTQPSTEFFKRTNVRFFMVGFVISLATGCGTVAPLGGDFQSKRAPGPALCERFGPETRCGHTESSRVARALDRVDQSAQLGFRGW